MRVITARLTAASPGDGAVQPGLLEPDRRRDQIPVPLCLRAWPEKEGTAAGRHILPAGAAASASPAQAAAPLRQVRGVPGRLLQPDHVAARRGHPAAQGAGHHLLQPASGVLASGPDRAGGGGQTGCHRPVLRHRQPDARRLLHAEASYLAASGRKLVLVVSRLSGPGQTICGEAITNTEYCDLDRTQNYLQDLVERQGLPVFETISSGLDCTDKVLRKDIRVQDLQLDDNAVPVRNAHITLADKLQRLREVFANQDSDGRGCLSAGETCAALRVATGRVVCPSDVRLLLAQIRDVTERTNGVVSNDRIAFEDFCLLVTELQSGGWRAARGRSGPSVLSRTAEMLLTPFTRVAEWVLPQRLARQLSNNGNSAPAADVRDVYLGGTSTDTAWRESIAIPLLKKAGLSFEPPTPPSRSERLTPTAAARLERCRQLLFVITDTSRASVHMTVAAHYIGLGARVVLCVQMLPDNCVIRGEKLTPTAIKDYNRGRSYLSDLATRRGVPVFEAVAEAVQCVVQRSRPAR
ncbi:uncharacterized protein LOC119099953 [Pollicipes pollicipes]|uniref:uncharacterized protein LOC119099953 n=1 Tax=Pollicipes pollicipes TaxID=41117 RepID=UPI001884E643|nr:uncharacterized protein LOC119099953 [Pollicipes pollicipes]